MNSESKPLTLSEWSLLARKPYLDFLRNLSPQILISSLAWVLALKLDFTKFDFSNAPQTVLFFGFLFLFLYAIYANTSVFLGCVFPTFQPWLRDHESHLTSRKTSRLKIPLLLIKAIFVERRTEFMLVIFVSVAIQLLLAGVFVSSVASALAFLKVAHGK